MTIKNGKIASATEEELFEHYLKSGFDEIMPFTDYKAACIKNGTTIEECAE